MLRRTIVLLGLGGAIRIANADEPSPLAPPPATEVESTPPAAVDKGTLSGTVTDATTQLGMPGASVELVGPAGRTLVATEIDGTYKLDLPAGAYTLTVTTPEFVTQVRPVTIVIGRASLVDVALAPDVRQGGEETVEVYDTIDNQRASAVLAERRLAATVSDAVSAEQIARSPDSSASDAAKRMVAATIQDGRYVVIRGPRWPVLADAPQRRAPAEPGPRRAGGAARPVSGSADLESHRAEVVRAGHAR